MSHVPLTKYGAYFFAHCASASPTPASLSPLLLLLLFFARGSISLASSRQRNVSFSRLHFRVPCLPRHRAKGRQIRPSYNSGWLHGSPSSRRGENFRNEVYSLHSQVLCCLALVWHLPYLCYSQFTPNFRVDGPLPPLPSSASCLLPSALG